MYAVRHLTLSQLVAAKVVIPAISYFRVSSEKQLRGEGLRRQREGNIKWIAKHPELNIRVDDEKTDGARSAWKADHIKGDSALGSILRQVQSGALRPPLMLIVEHLDRLSRQNEWQAQEQLAGLVNRGVLVATTKDDRIYSTESGIGDLILSVVYMSAAHEESEKKSDRVSEAKRMHVIAAMKTKYVIHQNSVGWTRVSEPISSTNRTTRKYELIDHHAATVLTMYQMALHHGDGYICSWLIENNVQAMGRSAQWNIRQVKRILRSRAVLGHLESRHGLIENIYPPIPGLTEDLWLRVQAAIRQRSESDLGGNKVGARANLLAGLGVCQICGGKMRINKHARMGHRYYECANHSVLKKCANRSRYRVDRVEDAIFEHLDFLEISTAPEVLGNLTTLTDEHTKLVARQKRLERKLQELDDDEEFDIVMGQLRELRSKVKDAATAVSVAQQQSAVAAAPMTLTRDADRNAIATGLKARLATALFDDSRSVMVLSRAGVVLLVPPDEPATMLFKSPTGQVASVQGGRVLIDPPAFKGLLDRLPSLDRRTIDDIQKLLH